MTSHPPSNDRRDDEPHRDSFARAVDETFESGFANGPASPDRHALARLLGLLDLPKKANKNRDLLINVTVARIARDRADGERLATIGTDSPDQPLTPESARSLDAIQSDGWSTDRPADDRASRAAGLLSALDLPGAVSDDERDALVGRTLGAIQSQIEENQNRFRMDPVRDLQAVRPRITLQDLASVAAMVLIAGAIIWPLLTGLREASNERLCAHDLSQAGMGFAMYASDHDGRLPSRETFAQTQAHARKNDASRPWWSVGESLNSHSANLFTLVRDGYASMSSLSCPGNENAPAQVSDQNQHDWSSLEEVSYSYQVFRGVPPRLGSSRSMVVLADKSPVIPRARLGEPFNPTARSLNHGGRGQNLLMSDLRVVFTKEPFRPGSRDNIWLPRHFEVGRSVPLTGTETPADDVDAFVGP